MSEKRGNKVMGAVPGPVYVGSHPTANTITAAILAGISERFGGRVVAWRNNRIDAMATGRGGRTRRVSAGINGQADITGIMPDGRRLEIEVKAAKDVQSPSQLGFMKMIQIHYGIYIVARDAGKCLNAISDEIQRAHSLVTTYILP